MCLNLAINDEWMEECEMVWAQHKRGPWRMGDLVLEGIAEFTDGSKDQEADLLTVLAEQLECSSKTLSNYVRVSREFPPDTRFAVLEQGHHEAVLKLDPEDRVEWLTKAAENLWTVARLRRELSDARPPDPADMTVGEVVHFFIVHLLEEEAGVMMEKRKAIFTGIFGEKIVLTSNSPLRWRKEVKNEN